MNGTTPPPDAAAAQRAYENNLRAAERAHDGIDETRHRLIEGVLRDAQAAIRIVLLLNGGAAIAVLAFAGSLASKSELHLAGIIISHSLSFVFGVIAAAFAAIFTYLANGCYAERLSRIKKTWQHPFSKDTTISKSFLVSALIFHGFAVVAAVAGMYLFIMGMLKLRSAFHLIV